MANVRSLGTVGFGLSALLVFAVSSCGGASGGSDDGGEEGGGSGGSSASGGSTMTGGTAGSTGGSAGTPSGGSAGTPAGGSAGTPSGGTAGDTGGTAGTTSCTPNPPAQTCSGAAVNMHMPADGLLINWETYVVSSGAWGNSSVGDLTGGTSKYNGRDVMPINVELVGADLHITATIPPYTADVPDDAENYAGLVFWFGPCINASAYGGLEFTAGGSMGGAALKLQVQTAENYPADPANSKGACIFTDCATQWSECKGPDATVTVPAKPELVSMEWAAFAAGSPNTGVNPEGLVGLQFQLECQAMTECVVDMTLGAVSLTAL